MVLLSHPTGNANVAAVAAALDEHQLLSAFYTCIHWRADAPLARLVPGPLRRTLERRARVHLPPEQVFTRPFRELVRTGLIRAGRRNLVAAEDNFFSIDSVYRDLDRFVARRLSSHSGIRGVYAYEDGALHQFRAARARGIHCIYDLPIGYWRVNRAISEEEAERQPEWKGTLNSLADNAAKCARKDEEIALADTILVASSFTQSTLAAYPGKAANVVVIPYGTPTLHSEPRRLTDRNQPLRVLFVGSLSQRKGISYLFDAVRQLAGSVELTIIGRKVGHSALLDQQCIHHRWIPSLPHGEILREMRNHDVFVFPSLFEGFGLVIGEALSQGLPVITTTNTGGPDILRDGVDSFIVPIRDADAIASRLTHLHEDRELLLRMSHAALAQAQTLTWSAYQQGVAAAVRVAIGNAQPPR